MSEGQTAFAVNCPKTLRHEGYCLWQVKLHCSCGILQIPLALKHFTDCSQIFHTDCNQFFLLPWNISHRLQSTLPLALILLALKHFTQTVVNSPSCPKHFTQTALIPLALKCFTQTAVNSPSCHDTSCPETFYTHCHHLSFLPWYHSPWNTSHRLKSSLPLALLPLALKHFIQTAVNSPSCPNTTCPETHHTDCSHLSLLPWYHLP